MPRTPVPAGGNPKARLIAIASDHLKRVGKERVRLVAIAQEAGMTHANVYRYFTSRDDLLDAVAGNALRPIETLLSDITGSPDPADDKLERMIVALARGYRDVLEREPEVYSLFSDAVVENRPLARRHLGRVRRLFAEALDEGIAANMFNVSGADAALSFLIDVLHRFTHPVSIAMDAARVRSTLDARLKVTVSVMLRALMSGHV